MFIFGEGFGEGEKALSFVLKTEMHFPSHFFHVPDTTDTDALFGNKLHRKPPATLTQTPRQTHQTDVLMN